MCIRDSPTCIARRAGPTPPRPPGRWLAPRCASRGRSRSLTRYRPTRTSSWATTARTATTAASGARGTVPISSAKASSSTGPSAAGPRCERRDGPLKRRTLAEYLLVALCAIVAALLVQAFLVKPYRIPSESMAATLAPRDRVLVNRVVYRLHAPGRGDIVVIDSAVVGRILIKRVVALPGETISVDGGAVYIDGRRLDEPYVHRVDGDTEPTRQAEISYAVFCLKKKKINNPQ